MLPRAKRWLVQPQLSNVKLFPGFLQVHDEKLLLLKNRLMKARCVLISDGGLYDNLGTSCLVPGRDRILVSMFNR